MPKPVPPLALVLVLSAACASSPPAPRAVRWEGWSDSVFDRARREQRLVLLDLGAVWCHWCHVMEETTYRDPEVAALIGDRFIAVRVDQDSRPELSNRYEDYGWPATVIFAADGREIAIRSGYVPPSAMAPWLRACADDPTPGPSVGESPRLEDRGATALDAALRRELEEAYRASYDFDRGGFGTVHKYVDGPSVELAIARALDGDAESERMARQTLDAGMRLLDPEWGGLYQYSTGGDWGAPHFEKIMAFQTDGIATYARAFAAWNDPAYERAAQSIHRFLREFLMSDDGAFTTSQDADLVPGEHSGEYFALPDAERRARGVPRVDTHRYARENGWAIRALATLFACTGDESALAEARRAARWVIANRAIPGGGFRHDDADEAGPYLGDTIAMGQAFLALHAATSEREWLSHADAASRFIANHFADRGSAMGFVTAEPRAAAPLAAQPPQRDENAAVARFENGMFRYTGASEHRERAERAMRFLAVAEIARRRPVAQALLADRELASEPAHVTVVGPKSSADARALFRAAIRSPLAYARIEWWDSSEGPLPNADVELPQLDQPAAFVCAEGRCSLPLTSADAVARRLHGERRR